MSEADSNDKLAPAPGIPAENAPSDVETIVETHGVAQTARLADFSRPLVGECIGDKHPTLVGRILVRWGDVDANTHERWLPALQGLSVRAADRVLLVHAANWPEPVVMGVVDGFARRPEVPKTPAARIEVRNDETVSIVAQDGAPLLEVSRGERGPVVKLLAPDVDLELPGKLRVNAQSIEMIARQGAVEIRATDDVVVKGEVVHLNLIRNATTRGENTMELVNQTSIPAEKLIGAPDGLGYRVGMIIAKATFRFDYRGNLQFDTQEPLALFRDDEPTDVGALAADVVPRRAPVFEVFLHGHAYAPPGRTVESRNVSLTVGNVRRDMTVFGDREWESRLLRKTISKPVPFERIPLTWDRAFGGTAEVYLDRESPMDLPDTLNRYGRGFDAETLAEGIGKAFRAPPGFPVVRYKRLLPNLENPAALITRWEDVPEPVCWAAVPTDIGFHSIRTIKEAMARKEQPNAPPPLELMKPGNEHLVDPVYQRAHPDWIIPLPQIDSIVTLEGLTPTPHPVAFRLPRLRVVADYILDQRMGARALAPHALVLLPDQGKFCLVYRSAFTFDSLPEKERCFRLRLEEGWFEYPPSSAQS